MHKRGSRARVTNKVGNPKKEKAKLINKKKKGKPSIPPSRQYELKLLPIVRVRHRGRDLQVRHTGPFSDSDRPWKLYVQAHYRLTNQLAMIPFPFPLTSAQSAEHRYPRWRPSRGWISGVFSSFSVLGLGRIFTPYGGPGFSSFWSKTIWHGLNAELRARSEIQIAMKSVLHFQSSCLRTHPLSTPGFACESHPFQVCSSPTHHGPD